MGLKDNPCYDYIFMKFVPNTSEEVEEMGQ
jgi:hypothetical protein